MRRPDRESLDPWIAAELDAIDSTLAGEPVEPEHADFAELALVLVAERPAPSAEFSASLDQRILDQFATQAPPWTRPRWRWSLLPAAGLAAAAVVAVVVVAVVVAASSGGSPSVSSSSTASGKTLAARPPAAVTSGEHAAPSQANQSSVAAPGSSSSYPGLRLPSNGRKVIQSSQLTLSAPSTRIGDVAQEVFNVVGEQNGFVNSSTVTATGGPDGYAEFQLSVPSTALAQTMSQLSRLLYAQVLSRTDNTNDVTGQWGGASNQLSQAEALRTSLLKQLQNAVTQNQITSLQAQLADANSKISSAEASLRSLNHQISYSEISLAVQGRAVVASHQHSGGGGFTIGQAARDAGRVLTIAAGIALIALAVLVPLGLLAAIGWWIGSAFRRRRREQALDLA